MKHEINDTVLVPMKVVRILDTEDGKVLQLGAAFCGGTKSYAVDILESELDPLPDGEMSSKDAAEIIKVARAEVEWEYPMEYAAAFGRAIEALKKQEPQEVIYSGDGYADGVMVYDMAECPSCGYEYEDSDKDWGESFCPHCGQSLKWEE